MKQGKAKRRTQAGAGTGKASVRKAKRVRRRGVLDRLKAEEAEGVLRRLLAGHPELGAEADGHARSLLGEVTFDAIADEVEGVVKARDLDDLSSRAGQHEWGYVTPTEAAWEILEETVEPFVTDIRRRIDLGLESEALEICKGLVLGLYRVDQRKAGELVEWAWDFPAEAAAGAIRTWSTGDCGKKRARRKALAFPREFVDRFVPGWREMIERLRGRMGHR